MKRASLDTISRLGRELRESLLDESEPDAEVVKDILDRLRDEKMTLSVLKKTMIGKILTKAIKAMRLQNRRDHATWGGMLTMSEKMLFSWQAAADHGQIAEEVEDNREGLPSSTTSYRARLKQQKKDMYKDPPVLPPTAITVEEAEYPLPARDHKTKELSFVTGKDQELRALLRDFHPNRTPEEVLRAGSFGGTYFRPICSAVTNKKYSSSQVLQDTLVPSWIEGLDKKTMLTSPTYHANVNKYGVKCGGSLGMWESSGWICDADPYGWFQWYCRFFQGRRTSDDARQVSRWLKSVGPKGRFRSQLCNKVIAAQTTASDSAVSPVIRQTLLHWGLELEEHHLKQHRGRLKR